MNSRCFLYQFSGLQKKHPSLKTRLFRLLTTDVCKCTLSQISETESRILNGKCRFVDKALKNIRDVI